MAIKRKCPKCGKECYSAAKEIDWVCECGEVLKPELNKFESGTGVTDTRKNSASAGQPPRHVPQLWGIRGRRTITSRAGGIPAFPTKNLVE